MRKYTIYLLLFLFGLNVSVIAKEDTVRGNTPELRIPDKSKIKQYQEDRDFQYDHANANEEPEWLQRLFGWLSEKFGDTALSVMEVVFNRNFAIIVLAILIVILLGVIISRSQNINFKTLFGKKKLDLEDIQFIAEDVNKMNFDQLIQDALKTKDYRLAIRFLYLRNLKSLSDHLIIRWNPNKTNYSYVYEIENPTLRDKFQDTTRIFDFVWYGEFMLTDKSFADMHVQFQEFNRLISNGR